MRKILSLIAFTIFSSVAITTAAPVTASAASDCTNARFLTMPAWYRGVVSTDGECNISVDQVGGPEDKRLQKFILIIAFNIVEIMLHITAYVAAAFVIVGGFKYLTSAGSPDGNVKGRKTIINALAGLVISIMSIGIVNLVTSRL
jgi:heme A synthase